MEALLDKASGILLADNGRLMIDLYRHVLTSEIDIDPDMQQIAQKLTKSPKKRLLSRPNFQSQNGAFGTEYSIGT